MIEMGIHGPDLVEEEFIRNGLLLKNSLNNLKSLEILGIGGKQVGPPDKFELNSADGKRK